jgi:aryl-alcohol dehydrogenase-like predicted oxidoreductase
MEFARLGGTDISVSRLCLGTMTWGEQNTEVEGHAQMDRALDAGVNFFDTAEMYPVPTNTKTAGRTEEIVGSWFASRGTRSRVVLASKVSGPGMPGRGKAALGRDDVHLAVDASLERLRTDYIDLYQVHWPARHTNFFGSLGYTHDESDASAPIEETLGVLQDLVSAGKVRAIGVSNETPWGVMAYLGVAARTGAPRVVTVQNPYSLLNRTFEVGLAEIAMREHVGLLAYSPLAFGVLSGKYVDGQLPEGARLTLFPQFRRYGGEQAQKATAAYVSLARDAGLDPAQMALAYIQSRPFATSTILGATTLKQLDDDLASTDTRLSPDVLEAIERIHKVYTYPSP